MNTLPLRTIPVISLWLPVRNLKKPVLTFEIIAEECGVTSGYVSMWFSGVRSPNDRHAAILARLLHCDLDMIWMKAGSPEEAVDIVKERIDAAAATPPATPTLTVPHWAYVRDAGPLIRMPYWEIHAGSKAELFDLDPKGYRKVPKSLIPGDPTEFYVLEVIGQSMGDPDRANIPEGSRLLMHKRKPTHLDVVAARLDNETTLKRLHITPQDQHLEAEPGPDETPYDIIRCDKLTVYEGVVVIVMTVRGVGPAK